MPMVACGHFRIMDDWRFVEDEDGPGTEKVQIMEFVTDYGHVYRWKSAGLDLTLDEWDAKLSEFIDLHLRARLDPPNDPNWFWHRHAYGSQAYQDNYYEAEGDRMDADERAALRAGVW